MIYDSINPVMDMINLYQCDPGFSTKERFTPNHYLLYVHRGTGEFIIGTVAYAAQAGDLFFCPQGVGNTITASKNDPFLLSGIDFFFWRQERDGGNVPARTVTYITDFFLPRINISSNHFALFVIQEMIDSFTSQTILSQTYCNSLLHSFLLNIIKFNEIRHYNVNEDCSKILQFIIEHSDEFITIQEIGLSFNYHPGTLNRMVKKVTGMTIKEYQIDVRIKKAMNLLLYSNKSIAEIASTCGYQSIFFFSRQFKAKTKILPTKFRSRDI